MKSPQKYTYIRVDGYGLIWFCGGANPNDDPPEVVFKTEDGEWVHMEHSEFMRRKE